jgi:hypothetical protein
LERVILSNNKKISVNKKEGNVIHINYGQRQVANELKRKLERTNSKKLDEKALPYAEQLKKLDAKFILNRSSKHFIRLKKKGLENEVAHSYAVNEAKSEAIKLLVTEAIKVTEAFKTKKLKEENIKDLELIAKDFYRQIQFIDNNKDNSFTHYITDMEMIEGLSEEKKKKYLGENNSKNNDE